MTFLELIRKANDLLYANEITIGQWEQMLNPLRQQVLPDSISQNMTIDVKAFINKLEEYIDPYEEGTVILALRASCISSDKDVDNYLAEVWEKLP